MGYSNKNSLIFRKPTLSAWLSGGFGGISPDLDHILSAATAGAVSWSFLHQPYITFILIGCVIASLGGLVLSLVLRRNR